MAVSTIAQYTGGGIKLPAILQEGTITVTAGVYGPDGYKDTGISIASPIEKGDWVVLDTDAANTFAATGGNPVAQRITNGTLIIGQVITNPTWVVVPTTTQTVRATILAGSFYRVATVEWFGLGGVAKSVFTGADAANVVPGVEATLLIDASATVALTGGPVTLATKDVANGGVGVFSFHYVAKGTATVSILVGFASPDLAIAA
jgi:hypothetical protein